MDLDAVEIRVLGCLIEKQRTTPDAYPLSLNSLRLACNQSTNRDPVVDYDERDDPRCAGPALAPRLDAARQRAWQPRVKYRHLLDEALALSDADRAARRADAARAADARRAEAARGERLLPASARSRRSRNARRRWSSASSSRGCRGVRAEGGPLRQLLGGDDGASPAFDKRRKCCSNTISARRARLPPRGAGRRVAARPRRAMIVADPLDYIAFPAPDHAPQASTIFLRTVDAFGSAGSPARATIVATRLARSGATRRQTADRRRLTSAQRVFKSPKDGPGDLVKLLASIATRVDHRFGWDRLPKPLGVVTLVGMRTRLREKNLYDTGRARRPSRRRTATRTARRARSTAPSTISRPRPWARSVRGSAATSPRQDVPRPAAGPPRAESAHDQPRAADARRVQAGDDREPARGRLAAVRGARLVQPRQERGRQAVRDRAGGRRRLARAADAHPADEARPLARRRRPHAADVRDSGLALVGRLADLRLRRGLRAAHPRARGRQAPARRGRAAAARPRHRSST